MKRTAIFAMLLFSGAVHADRYDDGMQPRYVEVVRPQEVCWNEVVERSYGGAILGGIAGGILGNQVGGGSGRTAATAVGAAAGAIVGDGLDNGRVVRRCRVVNQVVRDGYYREEPRHEYRHEEDDDE